jgi:hypothetical protein
VECYHDTERLLREHYLSYRTPDFELLPGMQPVIWG